MLLIRGVTLFLALNNVIHHARGATAAGQTVCSGGVGWTGTAISGDYAGSANPTDTTTQADNLSQDNCPLGNEVVSGTFKCDDKPEEFPPGIIHISEGGANDKYKIQCCGHVVAWMTRVHGFKGGVDLQLGIYKKVSDGVYVLQGYNTPPGYDSQVTTIYFPSLGNKDTEGYAKLDGYNKHLRIPVREDDYIGWMSLKTSFADAVVFDVPNAGEELGTDTNYWWAQAFPNEVGDQLTVSDDDKIDGWREYSITAFLDGGTTSKWNLGIYTLQSNTREKQ